MARQAFAGNTRLEQELDKWQSDQEIAISKKDKQEIYIKSVRMMAKKNPELAKMFTHRGTDPLTPDQEGELGAIFNGSYQNVVRQDVQKQLQRQSANQGILTVAAAANAALNVFSRFSLGDGAYNAQVAGRVLSFEDQQKFWENTKRATFLAGSLGSTLYAAGKIASGAAVGLGTIAAIGATVAGQATRIYNENQALRGDRIRNDINAQYHRELYGDIVTRGNR
jgi:hypothetical protein